MIIPQIPNIRAQLLNEDGTLSLPWTRFFQSITAAIAPTGVAVGDLGAPTLGARSLVTNALSPAFGTPVVGGGSATAPVYADGVVWRVG